MPSGKRKEAGEVSQVRSGEVGSPPVGVSRPSFCRRWVSSTTKSGLPAVISWTAVAIQGETGAAACWVMTSRTLS